MVHQYIYIYITVFTYPTHVVYRFISYIQLPQPNENGKTAKATKNGQRHRAVLRFHHATAFRHEDDDHEDRGSVAKGCCDFGPGLNGGNLFYLCPYQALYGNGPGYSWDTQKDIFIYIYIYIYVYIIMYIYIIHIYIYILHIYIHI